MVSCETSGPNNALKTGKKNCKRVRTSIIQLFNCKDIPSSNLFLKINCGINLKFETVSASGMILMAKD